MAIERGIRSGASRRVGIVVAFLAAVAVSPPAAASAGPDAMAAKRGGKPQLVVRKIDKPPRTAEPGDRVKLAGKLRNRGRAGSRGKVRLIVPREEGATGGTLLAKKTSKRVQPGKSRRIRFRFQVPGRLAPEPGSADAVYTLAACVKRHGLRGPYRCREGGRALTIPAAPAPAPLPPRFEPGSRSAGDPLFPQVGNGGYDVGRYRIDLDYDPAANRFLEGTRTTLTATATQDLGQFSLDFQDLDVSSVQVDGAEAFFTQEAATPRLAGATQPMKLIVDPPSGIEEGSEFTVHVDYTGTPVELTDPDGSSEGWVRACVGVPTPLTCDGSFVVNEPNGAQGWFPANNHPTDKASFETRITAPAAKSAIGIGELQSREPNGDGTRTWIWTEDDPTATYLTTATVGDFVYTESTLSETASGRSLPVYEAIDSDATTPQRNAINASLDEIGGMIDFLGARYGGYPFDSAGAVVDNVPTLGYALEVQTRPHFATLSVDTGTLLHEYAHQWFGNTVSPSTWLEIWFNEGFAEWSAWYWESETQGGTSPADHFDDEYANASDEDWSIPPATLDGDPANLFAHFPTYVRGAMTVEGYRQIVGDERFFQFTRQLQSRYAYGDISTAEVIALAEESSGLEGAKLQLLGQYFQQWLYGDVEPTVLPASFG